MANLGGDGGVDGVAAFAEDFNAGVGGEVVDGDDHGVVGAGGLFGEVVGGRGFGVQEAGGEDSERGGQSGAGFWWESAAHGSRIVTRVVQPQRIFFAGRRLYGLSKFRQLHT